MNTVRNAVPSAVLSAVPGGGPLLARTPVGGTRRTTTLLVTPQGAWHSGQRVAAIGRDLRLDDLRDDRGEPQVTEERFAFDIDAEGLISPLDQGRTVPDQLRGRPAQRGLRKAMAELQITRPGSLFDTLLDDVVGTSLASGYGRLYEGTLHAHGNTSGTSSESSESDDERSFATAMQLTCVGFNTMHRRGEAFNVRRYFETKPPSVEFVSDDPLTWHHDAPMPPNSFRRRRMLQVEPATGGESGDAYPIEVTGYFRDTFMRPDGVEMVVHEYGLRATVSGDPLLLDTLEAVPGNLPLKHCPLAAGSALRLVGLPLSEIEEVVRREIAGPTGCTHLNDELRSLRLIRTLLQA